MTWFFYVLGSGLPMLMRLVFPGGSGSKESARNAGDLGLIPGLGRSPGEGNGNPLQYSCLENLILRGAWWAIAWQSCKESDMTERLTLWKHEKALHA